MTPAVQRWRDVPEPLRRAFARMLVESDKTPRNLAYWWDEVPYCRAGVATLTRADTLEHALRAAADVLREAGDE